MTHFKYITTTLPYANSVPHIGHSFEFILGDAITRFYRKELGRDNVLFSVGLDEHGKKVWDKAKELNIDVEKYLIDLTDKWKQFCKSFDISYNIFYKTSSFKHQAKVQRFWRQCLKRDDIYKKHYTGKYCVGCESFKLDKDLINDKCPQHDTLEIQFIEEENYFFRLSKYKGQLLKWIDKDNNFLFPQYKTEELRNLISDSEDISVSRLKKNVPWAIDVPDDQWQTIYCWFEALLNYIFACGYDDDEFKDKWKNTLQICGPDNLRFQAVIFQSFLVSASIKNTKELLVHGTILDSEGKKMSKTLGNVIDPIDQLQKYGVDAVRYHTLAGLNTFDNSSWSEKELIETYNAELADDYGNLIARVLHLIDQKKVDVSQDNIDRGFKELIESKVCDVKSLWRSYDIRQALRQTNEIVKYGNKYIGNAKPWEQESYFVPLHNLYWLLQQITELYEPVIPQKVKEIKQALQQKKKVILFKKLEVK